MRKLKYAWLFIIIIVSLSACVKGDKEKINFLGGYGDISEGSYSNSYVSAFYEDDIYIYYGKFKINKNSGQFLPLCENSGCTHDNPNCIEYLYGGKIFPTEDRIYYSKGKELYTIDIEGNTEYIDTFDTNKEGIKLDEYRAIDQVIPINDNCLFIACSEGSCFYNLNTQEKLYVFSYFMCGNDNYVYYFDQDSDSIIRLIINSWTTEKLDNTSKMYPCVCVEDKLYCNTVYGTVCCFDSDGACEVVLADEALYYKLVGIKDNRILYCVCNLDNSTGMILEYDIYSMNIDGTNSVRLNEEAIKTIDLDSFFVGNNTCYMLDLDNKMNIQGIYKIGIDDNSLKYYKGEINYFQNDDSSDNDDTGDINYMQSIKGYDMMSNFYIESKDPMTGHVSLIPQKQQIVLIDGTRHNMIYKYSVDVRGAYAEEGFINIFVMCDGIIQKSSVNGEEDKLINQIPYVDEEEMTVSLEFNLENASLDGSFMVCSYLSDALITDDYNEYGNYHEGIIFDYFTYRVDENYILEYVNPSPYYSNYNIEEVYSLEEGDEFDLITEFGMLSNCIPAKKQKDRWKLELNDDEKLNIIYHNIEGQYNLYLLVDDVPVKLSEEEMLLCDINGNYDSVVYELTAKDVISPGEPHTVKLICYNRGTGMVDLYGYQIIQVKE
ncbi:MAG: hypothetical protein ACI4D8_07970 [Wujia sp.]